jgi:S1-C subfamily serine protease
MGVSSTTIDQATATQFGLPVSRGALVQFVEPDSPADKGGLARGDIIIEIEGRDIRGVEDVFAAVRSARVGDAVSVTVVRQDTERVFEVVLGSDAERR